MTLVLLRFVLFRQNTTTAKQVALIALTWEMSSRIILTNQYRSVQPLAAKGLARKLEGQGQKRGGGGRKTVTTKPKHDLCVHGKVYNSIDYNNISTTKHLILTARYVVISQNGL